MTSPPFHVGDFVWCAFPEGEYPAKPSRHLHVSYVLAVSADQAIVAYTTSRPLRHAAGRPGVIHFSARQAADLGQTRAFWLHLWRVAHLPVTPVWFPHVSDPTNTMVGRVSQTMRRELEAKTKEVFSRHRPETEQLGPLRPRGAE
jgi:hypothetical protein